MSNALWIMMETTGLVPAESHVLELAIGHTDEHGRRFEGLCAQIEHPPEVIETCEPAIISRYEESGLWRDMGFTDRAPKPGAISITESEVPDLVRDYIVENRCQGPVHGYALHFHLAHLFYRWPQLMRVIGPRCVDVQTLCSETNRYGGGTSAPRQTNRALPDLKLAADKLAECRQKLRYGCG